MARTNTKTKTPAPLTHEGGIAARHVTPEQQLRRSVMSAMLWENEFYEDGQSIADRVIDLIGKVDPEAVSQIAVEARTTGNLRHMPLLMAAALCRVKAQAPVAAKTIAGVIQRADELAEFVAIYMRINSQTKVKLSKQAKLGLAAAFRKFGAYDLGKYNRDGDVKLRDVLFLCHAKPKDAEQEALWKRLIDGTLETPDTWEVALSGGADKRATFERLIGEGKLGYLALLRNLRNMEQAGVDRDLVEGALLARRGANRVLPFRYIAAAKAAPSFEPAIDSALKMALAEAKRIDGDTIILVDVSGSMGNRLSAKSDMTRMDAAAALAALWPGRARVFSFSDGLVEVPQRAGIAGVDAIIKSQKHSGTNLALALHSLHDKLAKADRLVIITDEQARDTNGPLPGCNGRNYLINVASAKNGVGYGKGWVHLDGFSESVIKWIAAMEADDGL